MYFSHFGLSEAPFSITPNPNFFYSGSSRGDILAALLYAVSHGEGIVKVTGEVGSGKTMLCRMLESQLPPNVDVIFLANPSLAREQVAYALAGELLISTLGKRHDEVTRMLQQELIGRHIQGRQVVLLVEEAQAMSLETLEEIRLFSNLETAHHKLLQIILFGQPELDVNLALPRMRQLKERITHSFHVPPIANEQVGDFLMFRMRQAGYVGPNVFSQGAVKQITRVSQGIVRRINILADKAMLAAFADNSKQITAKQMRAAIHDSEFVRHGGLFRADVAWKAGLALAVLAALVAAYMLGRQNSPSQPVPLPAAHAAVANKETPPPSANVAASAVAPSPSPAPAPVITHAAPTSSENNAPAATSAPVVATPIAHNAAVGASVSPPSASVKDATAAKQEHSDAAALANASPNANPSAGAMALPNNASAATIASKPTTKYESPLAQRLAATRGWLLDTRSDRHTLQLTLVAANKQVEIMRFMQKVQLDVGMEQQLYVYPTRIGGIPRYGVLLGSYANRAEAKEKQDLLLRDLGYSSQIRTVGGLRDEMHKSHSEDLWAGR